LSLHLLLSLDIFFAVSACPIFTVTFQFSCLWAVSTYCRIIYPVPSIPSVCVIFYSVLSTTFTFHYSPVLLIPVSAVI
jgi:hypothetical protein